MHAPAVFTWQFPCVLCVETERGFDTDDEQYPLPPPQQFADRPQAQQEPIAESKEPDESDLLDVYKAVQGLDLCSQMLGVTSETSEQESQSYRGYESEILRKGNTLEEEENRKDSNAAVGVNVVKIDARSRRQGREATLAGLAAIAKEFDVDGTEDDDKENEREERSEEDENDMFGYL